MFTVQSYPAFLALVLLVFLARPAAAFGAGNVASISKIEGSNWRHGDIEDTLLTIVLAKAMGGAKFSDLNVSRVYFGNWLRDYSQAIDTGGLKGCSAEAIRLLLSVLGFITFGYGSKEFEVTADRLGCYRPEDHIDNPKDYADNIDARQFDKRLRAPVNEKVELAVDPKSGMKNYIGNEEIKIMSSAKHVRTLLTKCIELGRKYRNEKNDADFHEALRLLGTALHCLEDFFAHSNYVELALIELGEKDVFPHVGRETQLKIELIDKEVYPIVTGTFGGVDFLHSVTGEVQDKITQNEIDELEGTLKNNEGGDTSALETIFGVLDLIPDGIMGGGQEKKDKMKEIEQNANASQVQNMKVSPREPEEYTQYIQQIFSQIMPAIEFHDNLIKAISAAIDQVPVLPKVLDQLEEHLSRWVFTIMAPFVLPVLQQIRNELRAGSQEIIEKSEAAQHIVFEDDKCSDPTHSMLSKDHFSNILNEIAGKTATKVVGWVVPKIMSAWDDDAVNVQQTINMVVRGVMHHPAQRGIDNRNVQECRRLMFESVEGWWKGLDDGAKDEFRRKLSRDGVEKGENHKEGVHDSGHGCNQPLNVHKNLKKKDQTLEDRVATRIADGIADTFTGGISGFIKTQTGVDVPTTNEESNRADAERQQREKEQGGGSGGVGGFLENAAGSLLGKITGNTTENRRSDNESGDRPGREEESRTEGRYGGGDEGRNTSSYEQSSSRYERRTEESSYGGGGGGYSSGRRDDNEYGSGRRTEESSYGGRTEESSYGGGYSSGRRDDDNEYGSSRRTEESSYGGGGGYSSGRRDEESSYGGSGGGYSSGRREEESSYGGGGGGGYSSRRDNESESYGGGGGGGYSSRRDNDYGETQDSGYGNRRDDENEGYSSRRRDDESESYGGSGGYGSNRRRDDGDNERSGGYGY